MITEQQLRKAAFWDESYICLECGHAWEEMEVICPECASPNVVPTDLAVRVLDGVEREESA